MKNPWLIPGQSSSYLDSLCPMTDLPQESLPRWAVIKENEPSYRRHVIIKIGEFHEGEVSDKAFTGLHRKLQNGPVANEIADYAWATFNNAVKSFFSKLAEQRAREILVGDHDWALEEAPQPVVGYLVTFDEDPVETRLQNKLVIDAYRRSLADKLKPSELIGFSLVTFDGLTSLQAAEHLGISSGALRNAVWRARRKLRPLREELGLA
ncbi:sigma-70 family RNA polymerase sigma factor [Streptomyces sp. NPDC101194]|uniref:sigma-70 family RNA polymerase sigma factor n=1 Tax=Streptomyces sp. NPDC101194 TaxID=3366127 RepID=UPI003830F425